MLFVTTGLAIYSLKRQNLPSQLGIRAMILLVIGVLLVVLGLFSGVMLIAAPLGLGPTVPSSDATLWVLFPVCSLIGYSLFVVAARSSAIRGPSIALSGLLLLLATCAIAGLVLSSAGVIHAAGSTLPLWYVMAVAGILGSVGAASYQSSSKQI